MSISQDAAKRAVGLAAVRYVTPDEILGVGTGSTVNCFIDALGEALQRGDLRIAGAVSSSEATSARLRAIGVSVIEANSAGSLSVYIDGADEVDPHLRLIKGGGGALTREKIVAATAKRFVCLVDDSKRVPCLGRFPLPVEVIPMARSYVARQLVAMGGQPVLREGFTTDNGNIILDVHHLDILDPLRLEAEIGLLAGVVCVGLFARRKADVLLVASSTGVQEVRA